MIQILPEDRWPELKTVFFECFEGSSLPNENHASIIADVDEETGEIRSFVVLEMLLRIGQVHSNGTSPRRLFRYIEGSLRNASVIAIASEERFEGLFTKYGMREMKGKVFRRDF